MQPGPNDASMKTLQEETFELPLWKTPLANLTFPLNEDSWPKRHLSDEIDKGTLHIEETITETGERSVYVVHNIGEEKIGKYRFKVRDHSQRICRYTGTDEPPWTVYCAVTDFGYLCETVPESERIYGFDLLHAGSLSLLRRVEELDYEYLLAWGLRVFEKLWHYIHFSVVEYQVGPERMQDVVSYLERTGDGSSWFEGNPEPLFEEFDIENAYFPISHSHAMTESMLDQHSVESTTAEGLTDDSSLAWMITQYRGRGDCENILYVSIIGAEAIDRFSFQITNEEKGECVAQTNLVGDFPPYAVIENVSEEYEITNIPNVTHDENVPFSQVLVEIDELVRRVKSQRPPRSDVTKHWLDDYVTHLATYLSIVATYEVAPEEYNSGIEQAFSKLGIELTTENISRMDRNDLDQISAAAFQAIEDMEEVHKLGGELLDATRAVERSRLDGNINSDASLFGSLVEPNNSIYK